MRGVLLPGLFLSPRSIFRGELWESERTESSVKAIFEEAKAKRGRGPGRPSKELQRVNAYQSELEQEYEDWADDTSDDLATAKADGEEPTRLNEIILAGLAVLLLALQNLGRNNIPDAIDLALGNEAPTPALLLEVAQAVMENEKYLVESLIPDLKSKIEKALSDRDILAAFAVGESEGREALRSILATVTARVGSYSGAYWGLFNRASGELGLILDKPIRWNLDPSVKNHCRTCLDYGDTTYVSWADMMAKTGGAYPTHLTICKSNDRCSIEVVKE